MALSAAIVWELQSGGSDNNGGGFKAGAAGTDRSQQTAAQVVLDNGTITTSITTTVITFTAGYTATSADVGNVVQMLTGTNVTAGFYEITAQTSSTWTVDRNVVTSGTTTNATGNMGGCLATAGKVAGAMVGSNTVHVKGPATFQITTTITPPAGAQGAPTRWIGYNTTRGDLDTATAFTNHPTIQVNNAAIVAFTYSNAWQRLRNFILDGAGGATKGTRGVNATANYCDIDNCKVTSFSAFGIVQQAAGTVTRCYLTSMISGATAALFISAGTAEGCVIIANPCIGAQVAAVAIHRCIFDGNTGAASHGVQMTAATSEIRNCVCRGNGGDGINVTASGDAVVLINNILISNGGYGIKSASTAFIDQSFVDFNAFRSNTGGTLSGFPAGTHDVTLTGDPFVDAAGGNYGLNNTAGAGAACRGVGWPGTIPGTSTTGYEDIGIAQHQDAGGSTVIVVEEE
jgi:hypothetical protein